MQSKASTVKAYLDTLPADRRSALQAVRDVILKNLPSGYEEGMQYGMIGYYVPHRVYPPGYHCDPKQPLPFIGLASQKNHMALYMMCLYNPELEHKFREEWTRAGCKLDMGKCCVRFRKIENVPLKVIGNAVKRVPVKKLIAHYESTLAEKQAPSSRSKSSKKKSKTASRKKTASKARTRRAT